MAQGSARPTRWWRRGCRRPRHCRPRSSLDAATRPRLVVAGGSVRWNPEGPSALRDWVPATDLTEAEGEYVLRADLPGVEECVKGIVDVSRWMP